MFGSSFHISNDGFKYQNLKWPKGEFQKSTRVGEIWLTADDNNNKDHMCGDNTELRLISLVL